MTLGSDEFLTLVTELSALMGTSATRVEADDLIDRVLGTAMIRNSSADVQRYHSTTLRGISALWYGSMGEVRTLLGRIDLTHLERDIFFAERLTAVEEMGDEGAARDLSREYASSRASGAPLSLDGVALRALRKHRGMPGDKVSQLRDRWLGEAQKDVSWRTWVRYWADAAETVEDAASAIARRDEYPPVPESPDPRESAGVGHDAHSSPVAHAKPCPGSKARRSRANRS